VPQAEQAVAGKVILNIKDRGVNETHAPIPRCWRSARFIST